MEYRFESSLDWRNPAAYAVLAKADRNLFAWEWLRRDPEYRAAAAAACRCEGYALADPDAARFGLVRFESPDVPVPLARPLWRASLHPHVLVCEPNVARTGQLLELAGLRKFTHVAQSSDVYHVLFSDGLRAIRLDVPENALAGSSLSLCCRFGGAISPELPLLALQRLVALVRTGRFARSLHRPEASAHRWILQLRAHDAILAGAHQREIADRLLCRSAGRPHWRSHDPSLRSQVQRLVRSAHALASGDFLRFLDARQSLVTGAQYKMSPARSDECPASGSPPVITINSLAAPRSERPDDHRVNLASVPMTCGSGQAESPIQTAKTSVRLSISCSTPATSTSDSVNIASSAPVSSAQ